MRKLLWKEIKLFASPLSYWFILFGLLFFLPGYPILCGAFFVTLGLFQSFQNAGGTGDVLFSTLLPIAKRDVVKGKFLFVCLIEGGGFLLMAAATLLRMTVFSEAAVYRSNALMNANGFALGCVLCLFGLFNRIFVGGFFKTAYKTGKPFVLYTVAAFLTIGGAESLHHFPLLSVLNAFGAERLGLQTLLFLAGMVVFGLLTGVSYQKSVRSFEKIDL